MLLSVMSPAVATRVCIVSHVPGRHRPTSIPRSSVQLRVGAGRLQRPAGGRCLPVVSSLITSPRIGCGWVWWPMPLVSPTVTPGARLRREAVESRFGGPHTSRSSLLQLALRAHLHNDRKAGRLLADTAVGLTQPPLSPRLQRLETGRYSPRSRHRHRHRHRLQPWSTRGTATVLLHRVRRLPGSQSRHRPLVRRHHRFGSSRHARQSRSTACGLWDRTDPLGLTNRPDPAGRRDPHAEPSRIRHGKGFTPIRVGPGG